MFSVGGKRKLQILITRVWKIFPLASKSLSAWTPSEKPHSFTPKPALMNSRKLLNRLIILGFMGLVGYCLAKAISSGSVMGIILALVSLGAGVYFLYILAKAKEEMRSEESAQ